MEDLQTQEEWIADLEQRIVDLEGKVGNVQRMAERIGREKRTGYVGWIIYISIGLVGVDVIISLLILVRHSS